MNVYGNIYSRERPKNHRIVNFKYKILRLKNMRLQKKNLKESN